MKLKTLIIINIIADIILIALSIFLFIKSHDCRVLEMETQISQLGFYKEDVILLIDNHFKGAWYAVGGFLAAFTSVVLWVDLFNKELY